MKRTCNSNHPEKRSDEVFITNSTPEDVYHVGWETKRVGVQAYDIYDEPISGLVPVFAKKAELAEAKILYRFRNCRNPKRFDALHDCQIWLKALRQAHPVHASEWASYIAYIRENQKRGKLSLATIGTSRKEMARFAKMAAKATQKADDGDDILDQLLDNGCFLENSYVRRGGEITPWGCIRVFDNEVVESEDEDINDGLACWSRDFLKYADGRHHAVILNGTVEIVNNKTGEIVARIPFPNVFTCDIDEETVGPLGYLEYEYMQDREYEGTRDTFRKALEAVERGEKPDTLDNSPFIKVDPATKGPVIVITLADDTTYVFQKDGKGVPCKTGHPLSYGKWDPDSHYAQFSHKEYQAATA